MEIEALLLQQTPTGESSLRLAVLSPREGHLTVFKKTGKTLSPRAQPDLFDTATLHIQTSKDGKFHHLSSYHPISRRNQIPRNYRNFQTACQLTNFLNMNAPWIEDSTSTFRLAEKALDALNSSMAHPAIIALKTLYTLLKQEGYPVRQDWRVNIPHAQQEDLSMILHSPLDQLHQVPGETVLPLLDKLQTWMRHHTSFHLS